MTKEIMDVQEISPPISVKTGVVLAKIRKKIIIWSSFHKWNLQNTFGNSNQFDRVTKI